MSRFASLIAAGLIAAVPGMAHAAPGGAGGGTGGLTGGPVSCEPVNVKATYDSALQSALNCQNGIASNDQPLPGAVNSEEFFGHSDWLYLAKYDGSTHEGQDIDLGVTGFGSLSGTWSVAAGTFAPFEQFMIVLKAGTEFAGYFFNNTSTVSGTWGYDAPPGLSHLTVYARGQAQTPPDGNSDVPEPATLGLFALGMLGLAGGRRRKKR